MDTHHSECVFVCVVCVCVCAWCVCVVCVCVVRVITTEASLACKNTTAIIS